MDNEKINQVPKKKNYTTIIIIAVVLFIVISIGAAIIGAGVIFYMVDKNGSKSPVEVTGTEETIPMGTEETPLTSTTPETGTSLYAQTENSNSLQKIYISDPKINVDFMSVVLPYKWQYQSSFNWDLSNPSQPQNFYIKIWNPQEPERIEIYSGASFIEFNHPQQKQVHPEGSNYLGRTVKRYMGPEEALKTLILPKLRAQSKIVKIQDLGSVNGSSANAAAVIETQYMGRTIEEAVIVKVDKSVLSGNINWEIPIVTIIGSPPENSQKIAPYLPTMAFNETWTIVKDRIRSEIAQKKISEINQTAEMTRQIVNERNKVSSDSHNKWDQTIRGVENYTNPHTGNTMELSFKPKYTWVNDRGQVFQTDSATSDPNTFTNDGGTYRRADRQ